jgi:hypothetical protein
MATKSAKTFALSAADAPSRGTKWSAEARTTMNKLGDEQREGLLLRAKQLIYGSGRDKKAAASRR